MTATNHIAEPITEPVLVRNIPLDDYLARPGLNFTGIKRMLVSPLTYWVHSEMNPDRPPDDPTPAMMMGTALGIRIQHGRGAFDAAYAVRPDKADHPGALDGARELSQQCEERGLPKSGTIAELCARLRYHDPDLILWPHIMAEWRRDLADRAELKPDDGRDIARIAAAVESHPDAGPLFQGGEAEVSIFWADAETGVPMKTRLDYLAGFRGDRIVELKSFSNPLGKPLDQAVAHAVANGRLHIQAVIQAAGLARARGVTVSSVTFVFVQQGAVPNVVVREFRESDGRSDHGLAWSAAEHTVRQALRLYQECHERYGENPWVEQSPTRAFVDEDFPIWMFD